MRQTVIRCKSCGCALQTKRQRNPIEACFCTSLRHARVFVQITNPAEVGPTTGKVVLRE
jgi:hypothetical protein